MKSYRLYAILISLLVILSAGIFVPGAALAADTDSSHSVYFRPAIRFGTDNRTLYILDLLAPVYRGDKDLFFVNAKFTPDDLDAWEIERGPRVPSARPGRQTPSRREPLL